MCLQVKILLTLNEHNCPDYCYVIVSVELPSACYLTGILSVLDCSKRVTTVVDLEIWCVGGRHWNTKSNSLFETRNKAVRYDYHAMRIAVTRIELTVSTCKMWQLKKVQCLKASHRAESVTFTIANVKPQLCSFFICLDKLGKCLHLIGSQRNSQNLSISDS